jgi:outer membrane lipoprotein carrier protein
MRRLSLSLVIGMGALMLALVLGLGVAPFAPASARADDDARAKSANLKTLVARLQHHYQVTDSFKAKFKETITRAGAPPRERSGAIYYRKPGRIRWEFAGSQPETIVSDGTTIYDYDPGLNQVVETPLRNAFRSQGAVAFILGVGKVERDFKAAAVPAAPADGRDHIALTPKGGGGDGIELGVDPKTSNIMTLRLTDALGNTTVLEFSEIERNLPLEASLFAFTAPAGADIVSAGGNPTATP